MLQLHKSTVYVRIIDAFLNFAISFQGSRKTLKKMDCIYLELRRYLKYMPKYLIVFQTV